jgi:hypothetical protein
MKGSIDKYTTKGSSKPHWRYRIYLGKNEHGKKLWGARAGFEKQAEALDAMRKRIDELRASTDLATAPPTQNKTLGGWLEVWFDTYALDCCEPKTIERYRELADYLLKESDGMPSVLAKIPLPDLKHTHLEPAFFALLKAKAKRREHISAKSVRHVAAVVRGALNKAFKLELITVKSDAPRRAAKGPQEGRAQSDSGRNSKSPTGMPRRLDIRVDRVGHGERRPPRRVARPSMGRPRLDFRKRDIQ